jgi:succinate-semialdehyde dehydrogenase/glutarate-semialdehyde dehydrogenase
MTAVVTVDPATGRTLAEYPALTDAEVDAAPVRAASTQPGWAAIGFDARAAVLRRTAQGCGGSSSRWRCW